MGGVGNQGANILNQNQEKCRKSRNIKKNL